MVHRRRKVEQKVTILRRSYPREPTKDDYDSDDTLSPNNLVFKNDVTVISPKRLLLGDAKAEWFSTVDYGKDWDSERNRRVRNVKDWKNVRELMIAINKQKK